MSESKDNIMKKKSERITGTIYGNVSNASTIYGEEKFHAARGHGFAAERANTLYDKYTGHKTQIVGDDNAKNGADRILDGVQIQSKYCKTGSKCISECFENGKFRYYNPDGSPMQIEVPSDKYDSSIAVMRERIKRGEVLGVSDAKDAEFNGLEVGGTTFVTVVLVGQLSKAGVNSMLVGSSEYLVNAIGLKGRHI